MNRSSVWLVVTAPLLIGAGRLFGVEELYALGAAGGLLPVVCWIGVRTTRLQLVTNRRIEPTLPTAGDDVRVELAIAATDRSPSCEVEDALPLGGKIRIDVGALAAGSGTTASYRFTTSRRGRIDVGPATGVLSDPFGISSRRSVLGSTSSILVQPRWTPLTWVRPGEGVGPVDRAIRRLVAGFTPDDLRGVREFRPGDDRRNVDWKATARRGRPMVREFENRSPVTVELVLTPIDLGGFTEEGFERAVGAVRSFVESLAADGFGVDARMLLPGFDIIDISPSTLDDARRRLATVAGDGEPPEPHRSTNEATLVVRFTGARSDLVEPRGRCVEATLHFDTPMGGLITERPENGQRFVVDAGVDLPTAWSSLSRPPGHDHPIES